MKNGKVLYLEKRGCDFRPGDNSTAFSDIGNYRVSTPDFTITGKDGKQYFVEFTRDNRYRRALFIDICYKDPNGIPWAARKIQWNEFQNENHPYTTSGILAAVNIFSRDYYTAVRFIN